MIKKKDYFNFQKYKIYYKTINNSRKKGILFIHGKGSHSEYFNTIINEQDNCNFYFLDLPGFGLSSGRRGHISSFKVYLNIINKFINDFISKDKLEQLFIVGESTGSLFAYYLGNNFDIPSLKGIIFLPPILEVEEFKRIHLKIALYILNLLIPTFNIRGKRSIDTYTNNEEYKKIALNDPLWERNKSVRFIMEINKYINYMHKNAAKNKIPILMFIPEYDYYTDIKTAENFFKKLPNNNYNRFEILKNSKHWAIIDNDVNNIKNILYDWINHF